MPSEAPSRATAASWAAEPVWVAVDFDRACGVRRRGARWRLRAGVFASPGSTFAGLFACLRGCLLAIVFVLWIRIALRDAYTTTSPALGARRVATQKGLSTWTAMLAVPGKSSGKCRGTTILWYAAGFSKTPPLAVGQSVVSTQRKRRAASPCRYWHWSNCAPKWPRRCSVPLRIVALRSRLV